MTVPGVGPIISSAVVAAIGNGAGFTQGRDFGAWLGLVPKQESTGDRTILAKISKRGNGYLRTLFMQAARVILLRSANWPKHGFGLWAKAATSTIPIVFSVGSDPVKLGLVDSLNRPAGNITGVNYFTQDLGPKRLGLLRELMPAGADVVVLVNPKSPITDSAVNDLQAAASAVGQQLSVLHASNNQEDRKSTRLTPVTDQSRMPSSA